jgi:(p)ppGpp synthase/HD superfamily hydrolase
MIAWGMRTKRVGDISRGATPIRTPGAMLEQAIHLAIRAHAGQRDRAGTPYILHPMRVMQTLETEEEKVIAVLHDVIEDSTITFDDLNQYGFPPRVISALKLLTRDKNTPYEEYIAALAPDPIARKVKLADLFDNMDVGRIDKITDEDVQRLNKYMRAAEFLRDRR